MFEFLDILIRSSFRELLPFMVVVVSVIILALFALRIPDRLYVSKPDDNPHEPEEPSDSTVSSAIDANAVKKTAAVLFIDLRGFHRLSASKKPDETVTILNHFFETVGSVVISCGGRIDNYMGDGVLAVFDAQADKGICCRQAVSAIGQIRRALKKLNYKLSRQMNLQLQLAIALHVGPLLIGNIGHSSTSARRVVGSAVNTVIRLEELTKSKKAQVIISIDAAKCAGLPLDQLHSEFVVLRDNNIPLEVLCFSPSQQLPEASLRD